MQVANLPILKHALGTVFRKPAYILLAVGVSFCMLFISIWISNGKLLWATITSSTFTRTTKLKILLSSLESIHTNFTPSSSVLIVTLSLLIGINIAMLIFYLKKRSALESTAGTSLFGILAGILGVGCASCGSVLVASLLGASAITTVNAFPLQGEEFIIIGIVAVLWSTNTLAQKIHNPLTCPPSLWRRLLTKLK